MCQTAKALSGCLLEGLRAIFRGSFFSSRFPVPTLGRPRDARRESIERFPVKAGIHPEYHTATVKCACGNTFQTRSTQAEIHTDICNQCHPFYTGKQKLIDTAGRVER